MSRARTRPPVRIGFAGPKAITIAAALAVHQLDLRARRLSPRTVEHYRVRLAPFAAWLAGQGIVCPGDIAAAHVRAWLVHETERGLAPTTVHTAARALRAWLNFCVREEWIQTSPMRGVAMPRRPKIVRGALTDAQVGRLLRAPLGVRDRAVLLLLLDTGLRASELCALDAGDVDVERATVRVRQGKGGVDRTVYAGSRALRALLRHMAVRDPAPRAPLFVGRRGNRLTRSGLRRLVARAGEAVRLEGVGPHMLRRTYALSCLRAGMDIYTLARLMGHSGIDTLRHYLPLLDDDLRDAHERYSPGDRLG